MLSAQIFFKQKKTVPSGGDLRSPNRIAINHHSIKPDRIHLNGTHANIKLIQCMYNPLFLKTYGLIIY